jgi:hypothetical protein
MKYLLALLFLCACSSVPKNGPYRYSCHVFNMHGIYVHWWGEYSSQEDADKDAQTVNRLLIQASVIPDGPPLSECKCEPSN